MKLIRVAAATLNQTPLDWDGNAANIAGALNDARTLGVSLLCLPELCITGYGCEDAFLSMGTLSHAERVLAELVPQTRGLMACFGLPVLFQKSVYNACALAVDGKLVGLVAKRALAGEGIHYEPRWFSPWPAGTRALLRLAGVTVPMGDVYFECSGVRIGFEICEDAWTAQRRGAELALEAVDVILNPSASHFAFGKHEIRRRLVLEGSRAFGVSYVYTNLLGNEAGRAVYDGDALIASGGEIVAASRRFSFQSRELTSALVDVDLTRVRRGWPPSAAHVTPTVAHECVMADFAFPELLPEPSAASAPAEPWAAQLKEEEFARAIALGLYDYARKSRSRGFVVSLSGGADSAAVASLVFLMARFAVADLGLPAVAQALGLDAVRSEAELVPALLTTVYQATRNSGSVTRGAAAAVAKGLGAAHLELDVDALVQGYVALVEQAVGRKLDWSRDDLALQNVQARTRAPSVWMLANLKSALLLSTSNRSEAAVGYATMDGDTAGGLAPIAGIDKVFVRKWLSWLEQRGPAGVGPIPALAAVNAQAPTAELRPPTATQTDEADLMPYEVLDAIERSIVRDKRTPRETWLVLVAEFGQYSRQELYTWLERFFRLWSKNQWKRERYAPSFHVDDESLDPKTWCRFPILSGGFERDLAELAELTASVPLDRRG